MMKTGPDSDQGGSRLIFHWPRGARMQASLPIFFLFALILHALSFYLFQISYPPAVSMRPPPASLRILLPHTPETATLLARIDLEDPALALHGSARNLLGQASMLEVSYTPSFQNRSITPLDAPAPKSTDALPPAIYPQPIRTASPRTDRETTGAMQTNSRIEFLAPLVASDAEMPAFDGPALAGTDARQLSSAEYLVHISESGAVQSVFLQKSSGSRQADEQGDLWLRKCRFTSPEYRGLWGSALLHWGSDAYPPAP